MLRDEKGRVLAKETVFFRNVWTQEWGLRCREPKSRTAYLFDFGREVHLKYSMWFVFWPIDIHFLDQDKRVIASKYSFQPFRSYRPARPYWYAVEIRAPGPRLVPGTRLSF